MTEPVWLNRDDIEAIHETMIDIGGGSHGLRDAALLESAIARPQNLYAYGETDTFQLAASYAEGIARNHAFVDGNKRTAFASADLFLTENGYNLDQARALEHAEMMEQLGQGKITRDEAAAHLREHSQQIGQERSTEKSDQERPRVSQSEYARALERANEKTAERQRSKGQELE